VHDPEGDELSALTRTPNGLFGLVTLNADGFVSVINMRQWAENKVLRVGKGASRAYGTADGIYMMVGNDIDRTVTVLSTEPWESVATLPGVSGVTSISTGFFERLAYVVSNAENKVAVVDLEKMETAKFLDLPGGPGEGVADADGKKLYVTLHDTGDVAVIDIYNQKVHKIIKNVTDAPWSVAMATTNNYCH
jgi:YVTN family beta-propeller protein